MIHTETQHGFTPPNWRKVLLSFVAASRFYSQHTISNYRYGPATYFAQILWAETESVGCGYSNSLSLNGRFRYEQLYVCLYEPP